MIESKSGANGYTATYTYDNNGNELTRTSTDSFGVTLNGTGAAVPHVMRKLISFYKEGVDYILGQDPTGELTKERVAYYNDTVHRQAVVSWKLNLNEWIRTPSREISFVRQQSGIFYDLLPEGGALDPDSLHVFTTEAERGQSSTDLAAAAVGRELLPGEYTYTLTHDFRGSGRTLLTLYVNMPADQYTVLFDTIHDHDDLVDYGESIYNSVAYEIGNTEIGDGRPDDGGRGTANGTTPLNEGDKGYIIDGDILKNLDPSIGINQLTGDRFAKFLYAEAQADLGLVLHGTTGLDKKVIGQDDLDYSYVATFNSREYSYRLRYENDDNTEATDLIFYDALENYTTPVEGRTSDWHGTLYRVDLSHLRSVGIAPEVYYSTVSRVTTDGSGGMIKDENSPISFTEENKPDLAISAQGWTLLPAYHQTTWESGGLCLGPSGEIPESLRASITAIDMRRAIGGGSYVLNPGGTVLATLHLTSPVRAERDNLVEGVGQVPYTYNNIWIQKLCNRVALWMLFFVLLLGAALPAHGLDLEERCSLTVNFQYEGAPVPGASLRLYRVGDISEEGMLSWTEEMAQYLVSLDQQDAKGWDSAAKALADQLLLRDIAPLRSGTTGADGRYTWEELTVGLYLVVIGDGSPVTVGSYTYSAKPFLVTLPNRIETEDNGQQVTVWTCDITVTPKSERESVPVTPPPETPETVERRVLKIWRDDGHEDRRPESITVQLLRNHQVFDTQILSAVNNWRFVWSDLDAGYEWTVAEQMVPEGYTVSTGREGITILLTNTYEEETPPPTTPPPPETPPPEIPPEEEEDIPDQEPPLAPPSGEEEEEEIEEDDVPLAPNLPRTGLLWWPVPLLLCGGLVCVGAGVVTRRNEKRHEKE